MARFPHLLQSADAAPDFLAALLPSWLQFPGHRVVAALLVVFVGVSLARGYLLRRLFEWLA